MSEKKENKAGFDQFFQDKGIEMIGQTDYIPTFDPDPITALPEITELTPHLPSLESGSEDEKRRFWYELRHFFRTGEQGDLAGKKNWIPPLLHNLYGKEYIHGAYPLWLAEDIAPESDGRRMVSLHSLIEEVFEDVKKAGKSCRTFEDNLPRLEDRILQKLARVNDLFKAFPLLEEALDEMLRELSISGTESDTLDASARAFLGAFPRKGLILPYSDIAPFLLFFYQVEKAIHYRQNRLEEQIRPLLAKIGEMLAVDDSKKDSARSADALRESMSFAENLFNFDNFSNTLPREGARALDENRRKRLENVREELQKALKGQKNRQAVLLLSPQAEELTKQSRPLPFPAVLPVIKAGKSFFANVRKTFDQRMEEAGGLFAGIRIAELETTGQYNPAQHDNFFRHFNWRMFSDEEWSRAPLVLSLSTDSELREEDWTDFNRLFASGRPLKCLVWSHTPPGLSPGAPAAEPSLLDIGAQAIAHRSAFIQGGTAIHPGFLAEGFETGIQRPLPALFHLFAPAAARSGLDSFLLAGIALESRTFPNYIYDGEQERWGSRFSIDRNPAVENDWVSRSMTVKTGKEEKEENLTMALTFGDLASQFPDWSGFFKWVPSQYWSDDLVPLKDYITLTEKGGIIPFIWIMDEKGELQKAAVSWQVALLSQSGADFWHFLQENAGVHSYQVEQATGKLSEALQQNHEEELARLKKQHEEELEQVRASAMEEAVEQLSNKLLGLELSASAPPAKKEGVEKEEAVSPEEPAREKKPHILELDVAMEEVQGEPEKPKAKPAPGPKPMEAMEPWIETELCTSCDECKNINDKIFQYDSDGKAIIADPKGGPFRDLVAAAEACPVSIIHPGTPWDPKEKGLEELMKKAERYN